MNSNLLDKIGMGNIDPAYIFIVMLVLMAGLIVAAVISIRRLYRLEDKYNKFMKGKDAESLEEVIWKRFEEIDKLKLESMELKDTAAKLTEGLAGAYQKTAIIKYDAFKEMGGKLSFSVALLNNQNDGFILTSMHSSSGGCYTYIKEVIKGESFILLSEEESQVLKEAINKNNFME